MKRSQHTFNLKLLPLTAAPKTLCILRLSALGDITHVLPVVSAIQKYWPKTRITWIIGKLEYQLVRHLNNIEFLLFDKRHSYSAYRQLKKQLHQRQFDVFLHMQVALRANLLSRIVQSPIRLGWDTKRSRDWHQKFVNYQVPAVAFQHQAQGFLSFARTLGLAIKEPHWEFEPSPAAREFARQQLPGEQKTLLISPCSSHQLRNWTSSGYAAVADYAIRKLNMRVVLSGGPGKLEAGVGKAIEQQMQYPAINLIGKDNLQQSLGLLQRASLVLSPDSGPAHIANALGTPVIGLYAATWSARSGPYLSLERCVDRFPEAARKFLHKDPRKLRWGTKIEAAGVMELIQVKAVISQLETWKNPPEPGQDYKLDLPILNA